MRKLLVLAAVALASLLAWASPSQAHSTSRCEGTFTGRTFDRSIVVPPNGNCTLIDSRVRGSVRAQKDSYFQATNTRISGDVVGDEAQTIFIDTGTRVKGRIKGEATIQVFVFNAKVTGDIRVEEATDRVHICGNSVTEGNIKVLESSRDILVGDPSAVDCAGNVVRRGSVLVEDNFTDVELVVSGNTLRTGDLRVLENFGSSDKFVQGNTGGDDLVCTENDQSFVASGNTGWDTKQGQCSGP
jgi:hypothetical protein